MRRGSWHQFGDRSQRLALEQLEHGFGGGVVFSPRDLAPGKMEEYAKNYSELGAEILIDHQFYIPDASVGKLAEHGTFRFREAVSRLGAITDAELGGLASELRAGSAAVGATAVLAPGIVLEAGRQEIPSLNQRLFEAAKLVGDDLGVPTYGTIAVGRSATSVDGLTEAALSQATSVPADGWYFLFEFNGPRVPNSQENILRFCKACLTLASTGKPLFHAYAGPLSIISIACGAAAAGVGHSQNVWQFNRQRWEPSAGQGGGGDAPARFFSDPLWGTIVYPDELAQLSGEVRDEIVASTAFSMNVQTRGPFTPWDRWTANKHLVASICRATDELQAAGTPRVVADAVEAKLELAISLHERVEREGIVLGDGTASYQAPWLAALRRVRQDRGGDYDYIELLCAND